MDKKNITGMGILFLIILSIQTSADPPTNINVEGRGFYPNGTGLENGWDVHINNTNNSDYTITQTSAPPLPQFRGSYSGTINGVLGDLIEVWIYNSTHYGINSTYATTTTINVDVTINTTRPSETNVTIINPLNNTIFYQSKNNNLTGNVSIIGGNDGVSCTAQISFSNNSVLTANSTTYDLGNINLGNFKLSYFNLSVIGIGSTDITLNASCTSDSKNFDNLNFDSAYNITTYDDVSPTINLEFPLDSNITIADNNITFYYNVSDFSNINNCSLYLNGEQNASDFSVLTNNSETISQVISNGIYNWSIGCYDSYNNLGFSNNRTINISVYSPTITSITINDPISLTPNINTTIYCNYSVQDLNGASDIVSTNSTFYDYRVNPNGLQDFNNLYNNASCVETFSGGNQKNYSCTYDLVFYTNNGTWTCNPRVYDSAGHLGELQKNTTIDPLYSFELNPVGLDYGTAPPAGMTQEAIINVTNSGNVNFSLYLWGYGGFDNTTGSGNSFHCVGNNISIGLEKYANSPGVSFAAKKNLTSNSADSGFDVVKRTNTSNSSISTYWQLQIPAVVPQIQFGKCNGTVVFEVFE